MNLQAENFKQELIKFINNCNSLPIVIVYYIVKEICDQIQKIYYKVIEDQKQKQYNEKIQQQQQQNEDKEKGETK